MRILVYNYSHHGSTQAMYLARTFHSLEGCETNIFDNRTSLYDAYDTFNPDYVITNGSINLNDLLFYSKNVDKSIGHLFNIDYLDEQNLNSMNSYVKENDIDCKFFFGVKEAPSKIKLCKPYLRIPNAVDDTTSFSEEFDFSIDTAMVLGDDKEFDYQESLHTFNCYGMKESKADIQIPCINFQQLYRCYNRIIFRNPPGNYVNQTLIEALYFANNVYIEGSDYVVKEVNKMFGTQHDFSVSGNKEENTRTIQEIKEKIRQSHLPINRVKSMLSQLKGSYEILQGIK